MEILDFVKHLHDECIRLSEHIVFDKKHHRHLYLVALYGTMIELVGSLVTVIERKRTTGVLPIFRSFLEAYVELRNLHEQGEYVYHMRASYHKQWIEVYKEARNKRNPYLKDISQIKNLDEEIQKHEQGLADLKKRGYNPLNVFERFERAGMEDEYRSLYNFLSNDAHSNIRALWRRHLVKHENDFAVVYYRDEPLEKLLPYLLFTAQFLTDASMKIHGFFETGSVGEIEKLGQKLSEIRT
jgi:hypothetical protein